MNIQARKKSVVNYTLLNFVLQDTDTGKYLYEARLTKFEADTLNHAYALNGVARKYVPRPAY